jgi:hypothetical protein
MNSQKKDVPTLNWKFLRLKLSERLMPTVIIPVKKGLS